MRYLARSAFAIVLLTAAGNALAEDARVGAIEVGQPWALPVTSGNGAVYMVLANHGADADRLLAMKGAELARSIELHRSSMDAEGIMRMTPVEAVEVPAQGEARLAPGGLHVMLVGLKRPLVEGQSFPLTLTFEKAGEVEVEVAVQRTAAGKAAGGTKMEH